MIEFSDHEGRRFRVHNTAIISDTMVSRALQGFDTGVGDPNDYRRRMHAALEAALNVPTEETSK